MFRRERPQSDRVPYSVGVTYFQIQPQDRPVAPSHHISLPDFQTGEQRNNIVRHQVVTIGMGKGFSRWSSSR